MKNPTRQLLALPLALPLALAAITLAAVPSSATAQSTNTPPAQSATNSPSIAAGLSEIYNAFANSGLATATNYAFEPYQRRLVDDEARFKFALQARQTGKDFASAAEGIRDCYLHEKAGRKVDWLIAAPSERQSIESLAKWKARRLPAAS